MLSLCLVVTVFSACSNNTAKDSNDINTQGVAEQSNIEGNTGMVEPTSVDGNGSKLTGKDYSFTAFGEKYVLGESTLQDFLDDGWYFEPDSGDYDDPELEVDSFIYANTANLIKDGSIIYYPRFVNFSKSKICKLSECKLLQYTINFSGINVFTQSSETPSKADSFELPLGINATSTMADTMNRIEATGHGHYEQDYDTYYSLTMTSNYNDSDESYSIEAHFLKDTQIIQDLTVEISTYTNGEFDEP